MSNEEKELDVIEIGPPLASVVWEYINIDKQIMEHICRYFGVPEYRWQGADTPTERWKGENINDYRKRVGNWILDNPQLRWEYQKWVWFTPIRLADRIIGKIDDIFRTLWKSAKGKIC